MKRFFDILITLLFLTSISPLLIIISSLILFIDGRPIIYKQVRVGLKGRKFKMLKFRTMINSSNKDDKLRLTKLGKILRRTSLDELPQFFNILKKDMSIVGPRPLPEKIEKKINKVFRSQRRKVLPGITGLSQVNYTGRKRQLVDKVRLDIKFVNNYTLKNYFKIVLKTPLIILTRTFKNKSSIIN